MKNLKHLLYYDESPSRVFTPPLKVSYLSARELSNCLVRAKLCHLERKGGSYKCSNFRCLFCNNIKGIDTFTSRVTDKLFNSLTGNPAKWSMVKHSQKIVYSVFDHFVG